jgi:hypothetical protein
MLLLKRAHASDVTLTRASDFILILTRFQPGGNSLPKRPRTISTVLVFLRRRLFTIKGRLARGLVRPTIAIVHVEADKSAG